MEKTVTFARWQETYNEGDQVVVKPPNARCDTKWSKGKVTKVNSSWNVEVDGMPRHVQDVRLSRTVANESGSTWMVPAPVILLEDMMDGNLNPDERPSVSTRLETERNTLLSQEDLWRGLPFADEGGPQANEDFQRLERDGRESCTQIGSLMLT